MSAQKQGGFTPLTENQKQIYRADVITRNIPELKYEDKTVQGPQKSKKEF